MRRPCVVPTPLAPFVVASSPSSPREAHRCPAVSRRESKQPRRVRLGSAEEARRSAGHYASRGLHVEGPERQRLSKTKRRAIRSGLAKGDGQSGTGGEPRRQKANRGAAAGLCVRRCALRAVPVTRLSALFAIEMRWVLTKCNRRARPRRGVIFLWPI